MYSSNIQIFDKTSEFRKMVEEKVGTSREQTIQVKPNKIEMLQDMKNFNKTTMSLLNKINTIASKLTKLTELARSRSLFEEQQTAPQIQQLTDEIHMNIQEVNSEMKNVLLTSNELSQKYSSSKQNDAHRKIVCQHLDYLVKTTTKSFTDVLRIREESLRAQEQKKQKYNSPLQGTQAYQRNINNFTFQDEPQTEDGDVEIDIPQSNSMLLSNEHLEQRVQGVQHIESMLHELLDLYSHITFLVSTQEEMVRRIDENTDQAVFNVEEGHSALQEALNSVSSNRGLIIKSLLIVLFFAVVFLVFFL